MLRPRPGIVSSEGGPVVIFEEEDTAEPPQVAWASANEVILTLADEGEIRTSKHEFGHISIRYVVPNSLWDRSGEAEDYRRQGDKEAERLYTGGKTSKDDLRISLKTNQDVAQEWANFRQWVVQNAAVESAPAKPSR